MVRVFRGFNCFWNAFSALFVFFCGQRLLGQEFPVFRGPSAIFRRDSLSPSLRLFVALRLSGLFSETNPLHNLWKPRNHSVFRIFPASLRLKMNSFQLSAFPICAFSAYPPKSACIRPYKILRPALAAPQRSQVGSATPLSACAPFACSRPGFQVSAFHLFSLSRRIQNPA
jgi:hypothetical protein